VRTHAQSRAEIESLRARAPYIARTETSPATELRIAALHSKRSHYLPAYVSVELVRVTVIPSGEEL